MKRVIKQTILAMAMIMGLSLTPLFTQNVNAIGAGAALGAVVGSGLKVETQSKKMLFMQKAQIQEYTQVTMKMSLYH